MSAEPLIGTFANRGDLPEWTLLLGLALLMAPLVAIVSYALADRLPAWYARRARLRLETLYSTEVADALSRVADLGDSGYSYAFGSFLNVVTEAQLMHPGVLHAHRAHVRTVTMWLEATSRAVRAGETSPIEALQAGHWAMTAFLDVCRDFVGPLEGAHRGLPDRVAQPDAVRRALRTYDELRQNAQNRAEELMRLSRALNSSVPAARLPVHHPPLPPIV